MIVQNLSAQASFITKDGSAIRSILDRTNAPVQKQSLAEARVPAGGRTERHYHKIAEELYFILEGAGRCGPHPSRHVAHDHGYRTAVSQLTALAVLSHRSRT